jgi:hypothetical protein
MRIESLIMLVLCVVAVTSTARSEFDFGFLVRGSLYTYALANGAKVAGMPEVGGRPPAESARGIEQAQGVANELVRRGPSAVREYVKSGQRAHNDGSCESMNFVVAVLQGVCWTAEIAEVLAGEDKELANQVKGAGLEAARVLALPDRWYEVDGRNPQHDPIEDVTRHNVVYKVGEWRDGIRGAIACSVGFPLNRTTPPVGAENQGNTCYFNTVTQVVANAHPNQLRTILSESPAEAEGVRTAIWRAVNIAALNVAYPFRKVAEQKVPLAIADAALKEYHQRYEWSKSSVYQQNDVAEIMMMYHYGFGKRSMQAAEAMRETQMLYPDGNVTTNNERSSIIAVPWPYSVINTLNGMSGTPVSPVELIIDTFDPVAVRIAAAPPRCSVCVQEAYTTNECFMRRLERFQYGKDSYIKDSAPADIPTTIGLSNQGVWEKQTVASPGAYQLVSASIHIGTTTERGHYITVIYKGGEWWLVNDDRCDLLTEESAIDLVCGRAQWQSGQTRLVMYDRIP